MSRSSEPDFDAFFADLILRERATEADLDLATDAIANGSKTEAQLVEEWKPLALKIGAEVTLTGLKGRADLNGLSGTVVSFARATGRFGIRLESNETIAVKAANIETENEAASNPASLLAGKIGADAAELVSSFLMCTRCLKPCAPGSKCRVPHPTHLREDLGMMCGPEGMRASYGCRACGQQYCVVTDLGPPGMHQPGEPKIEGPEWCFAGVHTTKPLNDSDERRVFPNTVTLHAGPSLQNDIDALAADVHTLTITSANGFYDDENPAVLRRELHSLVRLNLVDVAFDAITLTTATTPSLQHLRMQNVPDECELELELPRLKTVSIHYLRGECEHAINTMLRSATSLERFDSYKLWVDELHFASNDLREIDLHRSDSLDTLSIWAPRLRVLGLQACYSLDNLTFLTTHPTLASLLPVNHTPPPLEPLDDDDDDEPRIVDVTEQGGV